MTRFLIAGYYGFLNSGDDAILTSMCQDINKLGIPATTTILSNRPSDTEKEGGVHATYRFNVLSVIKAIKGTDILLMGGGSLLQDATSTRSLLYYLSILWLSKMFGKKCMIYANGIGPIRKPFNRMLTSKLLNTVDLITVREGLSVLELEKLNITKPKIKVTADPVFSISLKDIDVKRLLREEKVDEDKPFVTVLFREWKGSHEYVKKMAEICDYIVREHDMNVVFIPMKYPTDITISCEIANAMTNKSIILKTPYSVNSIIQIIGESKIVLSMRLHALLYASLKSIPMVGFIYDPKVQHFLKQLKMYEVPDMDHFTVSEVEAYIVDILNNYEGIQKHINEEVKHLKAKANENEKYLAELVALQKGDRK